jgi:hypothetical protein
MIRTRVFKQGPSQVTFELLAGCDENPALDFDQSKQEFEAGLSEPLRRRMLPMLSIPYRCGKKKFSFSIG